jgi:hypothetical protein
MRTRSMRSCFPRPHGVGFWSWGGTRRVLRRTLAWVCGVHDVFKLPFRFSPQHPAANLLRPTLRTTPRSLRRSFQERRGEHVATRATSHDDRGNHQVRCPQGTVCFQLFAMDNVPTRRGRDAPDNAREFTPRAPPGRRTGETRKRMSNINVSASLPTRPVTIPGTRPGRVGGCRIASTRGTRGFCCVASARSPRVSPAKPGSRPRPKRPTAPHTLPSAQFLSVPPNPKR